MKPYIAHSVVMMVSLICITCCSNETNTTKLTISSEPHAWYDHVSDIWVIGENGKNMAESRTFGKIRRLQNILILLVFKFGVLSTMITVLILISMKTLFFVKALLVLNVGELLAKLLLWKKDTQYHQGSVWNYGQWALPSQQKDIHFHVHTSGDSYGKWSAAKAVESFLSNNFHSVSIPAAEDFSSYVTGFQRT